MPAVINCYEQVAALLPNQLAAVKGEVSLYDKLLPYIDLAEAHFFERFIPQALFSALSPQAALQAESVVVLDAFAAALPALDLVITPNGLATVGTQNLVAASRARVDALAASLISNRDSAINALLKLLPSMEGWPESPQGRFFAQSLFPDLDVVASLGIKAHLWDEYLKLLPRVAAIEQSMADEWLSPELLNALRGESLRRSLDGVRSVLVTQLRNMELSVLDDRPLHRSAVADAVNFIRSFPDEFPEWHTSAVAELFTPPVFSNSKLSSGYFF